MDQCAYIFHDEMGQNIERTEIPAEMAQAAELARNQMIEEIAGADEELTLRYLEGEEIPTADLRAGMRSATISGQLVPCSAAVRSRTRACS
jgi:elongation factor G